MSVRTGRRPSIDAVDDSRWRDVLVAIDVGTSGARAAAFDLDGRRRLEIRRSYPTRSPRPGWAEQDAGHWRRASLGALGTLARLLGSRRRVHAIGLTGQCPSLVLLDSTHRPIRPGLIYRDNRAADEATQIRAIFGDEAIHSRTGHLPAAFHIAPKLLWLRDYEPGAWRRSDLVLQPRDWLGLVLTGEAATDGTHAAATLLYDLLRGCWDDSILGRLELSPHLFPKILPAAAVLGTLSPGVAKMVGLPRSTPVVIGGADSQACALGAGAVAPGPVSEMAGSSTCLNEAVHHPLGVLGVTHYPHVVPGVYTTETGINTTGEAVAWLANRLYGGRAGRASDADFQRLDREVGLVPAGADGVVALPALGDGERSDPDVRGALTGLSLRHDRAALGRAILEGVAYEIRRQLELLRVGGAPASELRISGGDARLRTWSRIKADVTGLVVRTVPGDAAVTGVAMLAGLGVGVYRDLAEAIERCVRLDPPIEPDPATHAAYGSAFNRYLELARSPVARQQDAG